MAQQKKINTNDLPNNIGQKVTIKSANNTEITGDIVALGPDGTSVLMKSNKYWFYQKTVFDGTKTVILHTP